MLALHDVTVKRGTRELLAGVTATFEPGTFTAIVGANGVGKSSLLATMCGSTRPVRGHVTLDDVDLWSLAPRLRAQAIALVEPAEPVLAALTVDEAVASARYPHHRWWEWRASSADDDAVAEALAATDLTALAARELGSLSTGERQRVWIAIALAQHARVVAFDEPTSHLDLRYAIETLALLRRIAASGATVIAVLHSLEEAAAVADRIIILADGGVAADGSPADALTAATLARAFGVEIAVTRANGRLQFYRTFR